MLQAKLKVVGGRHHGKTIPLATKKFLIGREQDCHLRPNSELISRHHCVFTVDEFSVRVRDLGSTNGTFVNEDRVQAEIVLKTGDRVRVGKLDFELVIGELAVAVGVPGAASDSSQLLPGAAVDSSVQETAPLGATETSFEIPAVTGPVDTGSSILPNESNAPPAGVPAFPALDTTIAWPSSAPGGYGADPYAPTTMPYPQPAYQPAYPFMAPGMGYQAPMPYPQMPMGYPGAYPQMGMYPSAPAYPSQQPPLPEPQENEVPIPAVRLPDPKTTGAKAPAVPPPAAPEALKASAPAAADGTTGEWTEKKEEPKPVAPADPRQKAADILKNYVQRRPV